MREMSTPIKTNNSAENDTFSYHLLLYDDELSNDSNNLEIDESVPVSPPKHVPKQKIKLKPNEKLVLENIEEEIEKQLGEKAAKSNMSVQNVKHILKHIITNEQVLALVKHSVNEEPFKSTNLTFEPKLTRAKVKELLKNQPTNSAQNPYQSEVHILINEELPDDEEDEEYIPEESDDDRENVQAQSDTEWQPNTSARSQKARTSNADKSASSSENLNLCTSKQENNDPALPPQENIALRTRSKLSLSDTPLESIEQAFIPPDITTDMYDIECDDEDWGNFLKEFTQPLPSVPAGFFDEDDEADPEYNILLDEEAERGVDKEELRADKGVKVTKRELSDLVSELFDCTELLMPSCLPDDPITITEVPPVEATGIPCPPEEQQVITYTENEVTIPLNETQITIEQILLLQQQVRQHIQLLTQNYIQCYKHPVYDEFASGYKHLLEILIEKAGENQYSNLNGYSLKKAWDLIHNWAERFDANGEDMQENKRFVAEQLRKYKHKRAMLHLYIPKFSNLFLETVSNSDIFMYPNLLPRIPFIPLVAKRATYIEPEDELIALGLWQFYPYMESNKEYFKIKEGGKATMIDACVLLTRYLLVTKDPYNLYYHVKRIRMPKFPPNPVQFYFQNQVPPTTTHYVVTQGIPCPPCQQPREALHEPWLTYIYPQVEPPKEIIIPDTISEKPPLSSAIKRVVKPPRFNKYKRTTRTTRCTQVDVSTSTHERSLDFSMCIITEPGVNLLLTPSANPEKPSAAVTPLPVANMFPNMPFLQTPLKQVPPAEHDQNEIPGVNSIFTSPDTWEADKSTEESVQKDSEVDNTLPVKPGSAIKNKPKKLTTASEKKKAKQQKEYETALTLLSPENPKTTEEKANNYAKAYLNKMQERLTRESTEDFNLLLATLSDHDESVDSVSDLYSKVTAILSPNHPDLCEEFLTFLTPTQAKEIGKLVPHFMYTNMAKFLRKLELYFIKQPAQIRKIYNSLVELSNTETVPMEMIKSTIIPLLKGNTVLIDSFLQMFPKEKPPDNLMSVWEDLDCESSTVKSPAGDEEIFETINVPDYPDTYGGPNCTCLCHKSDNEQYTSRTKHCIPCGTKFIQGKVFLQTDKGPRPASVSFPGCSMVEQTKRLSVSPIVRPKRRSETASPTKHLPISPNKHAHIESEEEEQIILRNVRNSPKNTRIIKSPKVLTAARKLSLKPKIAKLDKLKVDTSIKAADVVAPKMPTSENGAQKKLNLKPQANTYNMSSPTRENKKKTNAAAKVSEDTSTDTMKSEELDDTGAISTEKEEETRCDIKAEIESEPMEWEDCNVSIESIELRLSPNRSIESIDMEESSQDLSECNEDVAASATESDNESMDEMESIHSDGSSPIILHSEESLSALDEPPDGPKETSEMPSTPSWTREEDKVILETFQQECDSDDTFEIVNRLLPQRTIEEIRKRFQTLMNILLQITESD